MADGPPGKAPSDVSRNSEIVEGITGFEDAERLDRLRLRIEAAWQRAKSLNAELTQEMNRLGLPLPTDKDAS